METDQQHIEALQDIRHMMKQSTRFLSLSGLSGVLIGFYALIGAYFGNQVISNYQRNGNPGAFTFEYTTLLKECAWISALVLVFSLLTALFFSMRNAKKTGANRFDHTARRLMLNMMIPLVAGGMFCLALVVNGPQMLGLIIPSMLIFYGLALVNGSKYTLNDIRYLGLMEIVLGIAASFFMVDGLIFWIVGFGILHILYGTYMWWKYERK
ncbi:MAG: hypothetical protein ABIQ02_10980 [Saprospiraceae bacterium]